MHLAHPCLVLTLLASALITPACGDADIPPPDTSHVIATELAPDNTILELNVHLTPIPGQPFTFALHGRASTDLMGTVLHHADTPIGQPIMVGARAFVVHLSLHHLERLLDAPEQPLLLALQTPSTTHRVLFHIHPTIDMHSNHGADATLTLTSHDDGLTVPIDTPPPRASLELLDAPHDATPILRQTPTGRWTMTWTRRALLRWAQSESILAFSVCDGRAVERQTWRLHLAIHDVRVVDAADPISFLDTVIAPGR